VRQSWRTRTPPDRGLISHRGPRARVRGTRRRGCRQNPRVAAGRAAL